MIGQKEVRKELLEAVYYDQTLGIAGTQWPIGTPSMPSNNLANIVTMCAARNTRKIVVRGLLTLTVAMDGYDFVGHHDYRDTLQLNNMSVNLSSFSKLYVSGTMNAGYGIFYDCALEIDSGFRGEAHRCTIVLIHFRNAANSSWLFDCKGNEEGPLLHVNAHTVNILDWVGWLGIQDVNAAGSRVYIYGKDSSPVTLANNCTNGQISLFGDIILTNSAAGTTVADYTIRNKIYKQLIQPVPFWSDPQLGVTVPAAAGTLTLPAVVVAGLPTGAVVTHAKVIMTARVIDNLNVALNKLNGATVAATSQVIQVQKGAGAWVDAICFIDDQLSIAGSTREGGPVLVCSNTLATTITGNDTYSFRWLLARADLDSLYLQGVHMLIQLDYSI